MDAPILFSPSSIISQNIFIQYVQSTIKIGPIEYPIEIVISTPSGDPRSESGDVPLSKSQSRVHVGEC